MKTLTKFLLLLTFILVSCKSGIVAFKSYELPNYEDKLTFLCDSLKLKYPSPEDWQTSFTVGDSSLNFVKYTWYEKGKKYYKFKVVDTDSIDNLELTIEYK